MVLKGQEYERALTGALTRCAKKPKLCQPWESDLMSDIFSDQPSFDWAATPSASLVDIVSSDKPEMCAPGETINAILLQHRAPIESCASLLRARPDQSFPQQDSSRKTRVTMWMETVMPYWRHFQVTRSIVSGMSDTEPTVQQVLETLEATFGRKSASTLYSRALGVHRYLHWCLTHGVQPFPMVERIVWSYVSELATLHQLHAFHHHPGWVPRSCYECTNLRQSSAGPCWQTSCEKGPGSNSQDGSCTSSCP